jgi:hypothetical protein
MGNVSKLGNGQPSKPITFPKKMNEDKLQKALEDYNKNFIPNSDQPTVGNGGGG